MSFSDFFIDTKLRIKNTRRKTDDDGGASAAVETSNEKPTLILDRRRPMLASQPLTTYISARVEHRCSPINHARKPVNHYFNKRAPFSPQNIYTRQIHPMYIIILLLYVYRRRRLFGGRLFVGLVAVGGKRVIYIQVYIIIHIYWFPDNRKIVSCYIIIIPRSTDSLYYLYNTISLSRLRKHILLFLLLNRIILSRVVVVFVCFATCLFFDSLFFRLFHAQYI